MQKLRFSSKSELRSALRRWDREARAEVESTYGKIEDWDVSAVTDLSQLFKEMDAFNADISAWNTSAVTNMSKMFYNAKAFNQAIGAWNTSAVSGPLTDINRHGGYVLQSLGLQPGHRGMGHLSSHRDGLHVLQSLGLQPGHRSMGHFSRHRHGLSMGRTRAKMALPYPL